ncbi:hypothetical protein Aci011_161 [Acinetobacter phage vB_AbaM_B09_Aci01-1]|uniref:Uncharacterized protein n=1 Tax=Acinetobacter phage vB_AbaM_B09_Aci01-1 TaxID=2315466 RepID=A0A386KKW9_9CAUD|nr:hypothetical protein HOU29_gp020 [Acinetobacter phage vB_AbaM_B09_Aci01-1]AYD85599.1 hypothetical protein Aci011_161 [Acinetobacter phage vB_AbaM_B09_Aci01-1]
MEKLVNVNHLLGAMGKDAFFNLNDSMKLVSQEECRSMMYWFDKANKDSFSIEMNIVNDGNNSFSDVVNIENSLVECGHSHDHIKFMNVIDLIDQKQVGRLKMVLEGLRTVIKSRKEFNLCNKYHLLNERMLVSAIESLN